MPGYNTNIWDPLSNMLASIRYAVARYGSLAKAYRGTGYAEGGVVSSPELAWVGEGKDTESIIPWNKSARSRALWEMTGRKIGAFNKKKSPLSVSKSNTQSRSGQINFNPSITNHVTVEGNASQSEIELALVRNNQALLRQLEEIKRDFERLRFG